MKGFRTLGVAAIAMLSLGSCSTSQQKPAQTAETATQDFRARCARGEFAQVYAGAAQEFRSGATEAVFVKMMEVMGRKLGSWKSAKPLGGKQLGGAGRMVTLEYQSQFANGEAKELFVWRTEGGKPLLVGYHINSKALDVN